MSLKQDWKEKLQTWMVLQKSVNNTDNNNMNHKKRVELLRSILSETLDNVLSETYFYDRDVLKGVIAAYLDVGQNIHDLAFRFPDLSEEKLLDRLYGLGLHLENLGMESVFLNPNHSALAKFGVGLQMVLRDRFTPGALPEHVRYEVRRAIHEEQSVNDSDAQVRSRLLQEIDALDHAWLGQLVDSWQIDNDRRKHSVSFLENYRVRHEKREAYRAIDPIVSAVRSIIPAGNDIKGLLSLDDQGHYCSQNHQAKARFAEDLVEPIKMVRTLLIDKGRSLQFVRQLVLEDWVAFRSLRPGNREAPELKPLRALLRGEKLFKASADREALLDQAHDEGLQMIKGMPDVVHKEFERSYQEVRDLLLEGKGDPRLFEPVTCEVRGEVSG